MDLDQACRHFQERDYPKFYHFKGEEINPTFLPEVFINYNPKIVADFDEAMEDVLKRLEPLEEQQKMDITQIQNKLEEILETMKRTAKKQTSSGSHWRG
jgi:hypothetical protein